MELLTDGKDVFRLERNELQEYLYDYIILKKKIKQMNISKSNKIKKVEQEKQSKMYKLNNNFNHYTEQMLRKNHHKAEKINLKVSSFFDIFDDMKFRYYFTIVLLIRLLTATSPSFFYKFWSHFFISIPIAFAVFIFRRPIYGLVSLLSKGIQKIILMVAATLDRLSANKAGVSEENIKQKFNYPSLFDEIDSGYNNLINEIQLWDQDNYRLLISKASKYGQYIPDQVDTIGYLSYMYEQIYIGAADSWKEAVNLLNEQIRHSEKMGALKSLSYELEKNSETLREIDRSINKQFRDLESSFSSSLNSINSRIDGLFDAPYYYY